MTMTAAQTARLLAKVAAFDNRDVGDALIAAWFEALGDLDFAECLKAVTFHFAESKEWCMPAHIRQIVNPPASRLPSSRPLRDHFQDWPEAELRGPGYGEFLKARAELAQRNPHDAPAEDDDPVRARALERARRERPDTPWADHRGQSRSDLAVDDPGWPYPPEDTGQG